MDVYAYRMADVSLGEPAFLILTALTGEPKHGYAVIEDVLDISGGQVRLHTGTLYSVLDRLRQGGLIEVDREEIVQSRLRRYYRLTGAGRERLAAETLRLRRNVDEAGARLAGFDPRPGTAMA